MLFNSLEFLVFFPAVTLIYFLLPQRFRWIHLLAASCYFYMVFIPQYLFILGFTIAVDYVAGIVIARSEGQKRYAALIISILSNILILFVFKYYNFVQETLLTLTGYALLPSAFSFHGFPMLDKLGHIILPIGLSFHTFQSLSYIFEVYSKRQEPVTHFGKYALFVMYYPQLVCGPIERPGNLLHQFEVKKRFLFSRFHSGFTLMLWGFFKKLVIADRLAIVVDTIWTDHAQFGGPYVLLATYFFSWQVYCDFSGYTDIARGASRVLGIRLMLNFDLPFFSKSIPELWRRWHISLTTWFRDYVYIPLGGGRVGPVRKIANIMAIFLLSGLWHGANWTYVLWGGVHGVLTVLSLWTADFRQKFLSVTRLDRFPSIMNGWRMFLVFNLFASAAVLFRSKDMAQAMGMYRGYFDLTLRMPDNIKLPYDMKTGMLVFLLIIALEALMRSGKFQSYLRGWRLVPIQALLLTAILLSGVFHQTQFIYFQF